MPLARDANMREAIRMFVAMASAALQRAIGVDTNVAPIEGPVPDPGSRYVVVVGVEGDLSAVTWVFPQALARELVRKMLGAPNPAYDRDAAIELANILMGAAGEMLASHGVRIEMTPPRFATSIADGISLRLITIHGIVDVVFHPAERAA